MVRGSRLLKTLNTHADMVFAFCSMVLMCLSHVRSAEIVTPKSRMWSAG